MITIGQWVDLSTQVNDEHNSLLYRRLNKREKAIAQLEANIADLSIKALQPADQSVIDELNNKIADLNKKLILYQQDANTPPIDMSFVRPLSIVEDMTAIERRIKSSDKCKAIIFSGVLDLHKNHGKESRKGNKFPDRVVAFSPNYSIALWESNMFLRFTKGNINQEGYKHIFDTNLERDRDCTSLFHGFKLGSSGTRYFIMYEQVTNSMIMYSV